MNPDDDAAEREAFREWLHAPRPKGHVDVLDYTFQSGYRAALEHRDRQMAEPNRGCWHGESAYHMHGLDDTGVYHPPCRVAYEKWISPALERLEAAETVVEAARHIGLGDDSPIRVGNSVLIRSVTHYYTGKIALVTKDEIVLTDADAGLPFIRGGYALNEALVRFEAFDRDRQMAERIVVCVGCHGEVCIDFAQKRGWGLSKSGWDCNRCARHPDRAQSPPDAKDSGSRQDGSDARTANALKPADGLSEPDCSPDPKPATGEVEKRSERDFALGLCRVLGLAPYAECPSEGYRNVDRIEAELCHYNEHHRDSAIRAAARAEAFREVIALPSFIIATGGEYISVSQILALLEKGSDR